MPIYLVYLITVALILFTPFACLTLTKSKSGWSVSLHSGWVLFLMLMAWGTWIEIVTRYTRSGF